MPGGSEFHPDAKQAHEAGDEARLPSQRMQGVAQRVVRRTCKPSLNSYQSEYSCVPTGVCGGFMIRADSTNKRKRLERDLRQRGPYSAANYSTWPCYPVQTHNYLRVCPGSSSSAATFERQYMQQKVPAKFRSSAAHGVSADGKGQQEW